MGMDVWICGFFTKKCLATKNNQLKISVIYYL